jgi:NAD(P)-dependent dehydrogenase (short-subunit alcohol dehydrogenase family)
MSGDLQDRVALVCGTDAICAAAAFDFAERGAVVHIAGLEAERGEQLASSIRDRGFLSTFDVLDIARSEAVRRFFHRLDLAGGRLDIALDGFGGLPIEDRRDTAAWDEQEFEVIYSRHLRAAWLLMKHQIRAMSQRSGGSIIYTLTSRALGGSEGLALHAACEHAVVGLIQAAAKESARFGVRINAICAPAPIYAGGGATLESIRSAIAWLASPESALWSGHALALDGGLSAF